MEPTLKRIKISRPYAVHPDTKQIYSFYQVMVKWPDGRREMFDSEEHAKAKIEGRSVNQSAVDAEIPAGVYEALEHGRPDSEPPEEEIVKEADEFDVVLVSYNDKKVPVIKEVRSLTGKGLKEAKELVDSCPVAIKEAVTKDEAEEVKAILAAAGATVEIK